MPIINTLDLGRTNIKSLRKSSFADLPQLECLMLAGNQISQLESHSIPPQIQRLHLGRNSISDLNGTLRNLSELFWLFVNSNNLTNLDGQLPRTAPNLNYIHASHNRLEKVPNQLKNYPALESIFLFNNRLKSLDGAFSKNDKLLRIVLENNQLNTLTQADFPASMNLESLLLGNNEIYTLNNSLVNLRRLHFLSLTKNQIVEFSFQEVANLKLLRSIDLSYNKITTLVGPTPNLVEWNIKLNEIKLDHNQIETLNGALSGLSELLRLDLSYNRLKRISPEDLIGLEQLRLLDISHNQLTTLEETSKTYLPRLSELRASHNYLTILEKDFHGLPVLCHADLSSNQIVAIGKDLTAKTRCTIEHGVHEGTWDTLKIYLQDNPILCDAALPDIMSIMEINHTRIYGVSHCPPLSEQPTTSKPTAFFGYVPETTPLLPAAISANSGNALQNEQTDDQQNQLDIPKNSQSDTNTEITVESNSFSIVKNESIAMKPQENTNTDQNSNETLQRDIGTGASNDEIIRPTGTNHTAQIFDPIKQGQQINKLANEIEELRSRIDVLSSQNQLLLNQQYNNSNNKNSRDDLSELRKP
nr:leucine-rich repeat-containing G-protein coupled receptor 4 isoform X2 [Leptinotarsa decemlineata]